VSDKFQRTRLSDVQTTKNDSGNRFFIDTSGTLLQSRLPHAWESQNVLFVMALVSSFRQSKSQSIHAIATIDRRISCWFWHHCRQQWWWWWSKPLVDLWLPGDYIIIDAQGPCCRKPHGYRLSVSTSPSAPNSSRWTNCINVVNSSCHSTKQKRNWTI